MQQLFKHFVQNGKNILNHGSAPFVVFFVKQLQNIMVFGCKQDILTLLLILFSTCKVEKIVFKAFNLFLTSQINWNLYISSVAPV
jgi:hypothetical protein